MNNTRTSNPSLRSDTFNRYQYLTGAQDPANLMTINGTIDKSILLLAILIFSGIGSAWLTIQSQGQLGYVLMGGGAIVGFVLAMVLNFKQNLAPVLAPAYAVAEGLAVGAISLMYQVAFPGIVTNAVILTVAILLVMLVLYRLRILQATPKFLQMLSFSVLGIMIVYGADILLGFFGVHVPFLNDGGPIGICISLFICGIASLTLIADFGFIESGAQRAPKFMEWYSGFSLLVSLVWLYLEVLRLLAQTQRRN